MKLQLNNQQQWCVPVRRTGIGLAITFGSSPVKTGTQKTVFLENRKSLSCCILVSSKTTLDTYVTLLTAANGPENNCYVCENTLSYHHDRAISTWSRHRPHGNLLSKSVNAAKNYWFILVISPMKITSVILFISWCGFKKSHTF